VLLSPAGFVRPRLDFLLRAAWVGVLRPDETTPLRYAHLASPPTLQVDKAEIRPERLRCWLSSPSSRHPSCRTGRCTA
jgi:hypothetical protein